MLEQLSAQRRELLALVGELRDVARSLGAASLMRHLTRDVEAKLEADRFFLVVVGEFNHGKTALVNALLGENVLPVGVTPTTAVIHQLAYADTPSARIVRPNGDFQEFPWEQLGEFASGKDRAGEPVAHLEIGYPAELLREQVVLVDTPGVNDLSLIRADITCGYLPRADAVLFVLDAGQPLKESEREFLEKQLERGGRDNLLFVVNKSDLWNAEEREEAPWTRLKCPCFNGRLYQRSIGTRCGWTEPNPGTRPHEQENETYATRSTTREGVDTS